jgi:hypothetical protein
MYGMVNKAVRELVLKQFGEDVWERIYTRASSPEYFEVFDQYDDSVTYSLVGAASEELGVPAEKTLYSFGEYWVSDVAVKSYASVMDVESEVDPKNWTGI